MLICGTEEAESLPQYFNDGGEFLYKFRKQDKLVPVATLVVYWGREWSGAKTLHDLVDFGEDEELALELRRMVPECPLHTVLPGNGLPLHLLVPRRQMEGFYSIRKKQQR